MAFDFLTNVLQKGASGVGGAFGDLTTFIEENPDQFAFIADTIGQALAPENPFAGAGTKIAQSRIASKAAKGQDDIMKSILELLAGKTGLQSIKSATQEDGSEKVTTEFNSALSQALSGRQEAQQTGILPEEDPLKALRT